MNKAQAMQQKMAEAQAKLDEEVVTGEAGAGLITVSMTAKGDLKRVNIDKSLIDPEEPEILEDLILAAIKDAQSKAAEKAQEEMTNLTESMGLPKDIKLPF